MPFLRCIYRFSGRELPSMNLGSYNYFGFAENSDSCSTQAIHSTEKYGVSTSSTCHDLCSQKYIKKLESFMADYLNVNDCIVFGMGFATNALNISTFAGKVASNVSFILLLKTIHSIFQ